MGDGRPGGRRGGAGSLGARSLHRPRHPRAAVASGAPDAPELVALLLGLALMVAGAVIEANAVLALGR